MLSLKSVEENLSHPDLLDSGVTGNPWCSLACGCITHSSFCLCCHMALSLGGCVCIQLSLFGRHQSYQIRAHLNLIVGICKSLISY